MAVQEEISTHTRKILLVALAIVVIFAVAVLAFVLYEQFSVPEALQESSEKGTIEEGVTLPAEESALEEGAEEETTSTQETTSGGGSSGGGSSGGGGGGTSGGEVASETQEEAVVEETVCTDVLPTCADGLDNDNDGNIDLDDLKCADWSGREVGEEIIVEEIICTDILPTCADGEDNDGDGSVDLDDSECMSWEERESGDNVAGEEPITSETCEDILTAAPVVSQPYLERSGANLVADPIVTGASSWYLSGSSVYDEDVSRTSGSGSIRFPSDFDSSVRQLVYLKQIAIPNPGKTYVFSAYMKSSTWPPGLIMMTPGFRTASGSFLVNGPSPRWATSEADEWQEIVTYVHTRPDAAYVELYFQRDMGPRNDGDIWIDDIYIGETDDNERVRFEQPRSEKNAFDGTLTKVDALGNVDVLRNGTWEPFFPLCMYTDSYRPDYTMISEQGFNCNMRMNDVTTIERSKNATSSFNPDGMLAILDITSWTIGSNTLTDLSDRLDAIHSKGLDDYLLMYYWDNEFIFDWDMTDDDDGWAKALAATDKVKEEDLDADGNRQRPIYILQGQYGVARMYSNDNVQMTDVVGEYVSVNVNEEYSDVGGIDILNNIEGQTNPLVFAQINLGVNEQFRPLLYWAIARGAKGMGFWRDYYPPTSASVSYYQTYGSLEDQAWWSDFPDIRREIDQMMPLIRQPHWTSWKATSSDDSVKLGTRDYNDEGYIILANMNESEVTTTITLSDLYYSPTSVRDFFTDDVVAALSNSEFTVTIAGFDTAVYRLEQVPQNTCEETVLAAPALEEKDYKIPFVIGSVVVLALTLFLYLRKKK